jgi:hypothetical protein
MKTKLRVELRLHVFDQNLVVFLKIFIFALLNSYRKSLVSLQMCLCEIQPFMQI